MIDDSNKSMTLIERYQEDIRQGAIVADEAQAQAVEYLQRLSEQLATRSPVRRSWPKIRDLFGFSFGSRREQQIRGLYFWGGVGRGKTYLMDMFFETLPGEQKLRLHFHRFMQYIHAELRRLQGNSDPLVSIADALSRKYVVLCLDEFFVKDITDAMILAGLLETLFKRGMVLVTTSNIPPSELYKDGLQRSRFLPAIDLLELHTCVVNVDGGVDYRLRMLEKAELYHYPLDDSADESLLSSFNELALEHVSLGQVAGADEIEILGRRIRCRMCTDNIIWFDFQDICGGPRSQNDYIELARIYHAVLISNVPVLGLKSDDQARRFIHLIDEFYDRNVKVILSAEAPIEQLYRDGLLAFEFERTKSRLLEMQSREFLAKEHRP